MERIVLAVLVVTGIFAVAGAFIFAFARRKDDQHRSMRIAVFAAVVSLVVATAGFIALTRVSYFDASRRTGGVHVVFTVQTYDPQTALFSLDGVVRGLNPEQQLWVVFRSARRDRLFPASAPCMILPEDRFRCQQSGTGTLSPGVASTRGYVVAVVPQAAAVLRQYASASPGTAGLRELPDGATVVSQISIGS